MIPIIIGVFTIIIAIQQQNVTQANRDKDAAQAAKLRSEDLERARLQREEDKESARLQREEDKKNAHLQREEEKEMARLQREEDLENARLQRADDQETARLQRELDLNMAKDKRIQEYELAEKQHSLYENRRIHEFGITQQNYMNDLTLKVSRQNDDILVNYQRDLSALLSDFRGIDYNILLILQMKTRVTLQALNPVHRMVILQTLFQANLLRTELKKEISLLYKANLSGVDFRQFSGYYADDYAVALRLSDIEQADVRYASFRSVYFNNSLPLFTLSNFDYTDWSFSVLVYIRFTGEMTMNDVIFSESKLMAVDFLDISMNRVSFQRNKYCLECNFLDTSLLGVRLDNSNFVRSGFFHLSMADSNLSNGSFIGSVFEEVTLDRVDLSAAKFHRCIFQHVSMVNCSMFETVLNETKFLNVNLTGCTGFIEDQMYSMIEIKEVILPNGTLI
jgi:uncharacterized protein YjbI with pentapeptide repeats